MQANVTDYRHFRRLGVGPLRQSGIAAGFLFSLFILFASVGHPSANALLVIEGATIIDGAGNPPIGNGIVLIEGVRFKALGVRGHVVIPDSAARVDGQGKWLIPGLIDMHVHMDEVIEPAEFLLYGVTSVRDVGSRLVRVQRIRGRAAKGESIPRVYWWGRNIDEGKPSWWGAVAARNADSVPALIQEMAAQGVDGLKLYVRAGPKVSAAVVREAHARKLPVTAHLEGTRIADAARMGIDNLEHVSTLFNELAARKANRKTKYHRAATVDLDSAKARALIALLSAETVAVTPTLVSCEMPWRGPRIAESTYHGWAGIPPAWSKYWASDYWNFIKPVGWKVEDYRSVEKAVAAYRSMVSRLNEAGVPVVAGTDTPAPWVLPGAGLLYELELYTRCGLTPAEAIRAATGRAAWVLGKEKDVGTIRPGCLADFILLGANPLTDIRNLRRIHSVFLAGRRIDRDGIQAQVKGMRSPSD